MIELARLVELLVYSPKVHLPNVIIIIIIATIHEKNTDRSQYYQIFKTFNLWCGQGVNSYSISTIIKR